MLWGDPAKTVILNPVTNQRSAAVANQNDLSRSVVAFEQHNTIIAVIEMSLNSWLVAGIVPGIERHPLKKLSVNEEVLLKLLHRWRDEAVKAGHTISRIVVAFEAGRDGFWLARWLRARDIEVHVGAQRPIGSTPSCSNAPFWAGCAASAITARWSRSQHSQTKIASGPTGSAR